MRSQLLASAMLCGLALLCTHCGGAEDKEDDKSMISGIGKGGRGKAGSDAGSRSVDEPNRDGDDAGVSPDAALSDARVATQAGGGSSSDASAKPEAGGGTSFASISSGVSGSKLLAAISDDDARKLCKFEEALAKATLPSAERTYCLVAQVKTTATCTTDVSDCLASGEYQDLKSDWGCSTASTNDYFSTGLKCNARVSAFETCSRENAEREHALYANATCESTKLGDLDLPDTTACRELLLECDI